jgi:hypothetical protein
MCSHCCRKVTAAASALIAGGVLAGLAAMFFRITVNLPLVVSVGATAALCVAIVGMMFAFAWVCDRLDDLHLAGKPEGLLDRHWPLTLDVRPPQQEWDDDTRDRRPTSARIQPFVLGDRAAVDQAFAPSGWQRPA